MAVTVIKKEKALSLFSYYGEGGKEVVRAQLLDDGTWAFTHKDKRRHWKKGWPDDFREPYGLAHVWAADEKKIVYVTQNEAEAQCLLDNGLCGVCFRDWIVSSKASDDWLLAFLNRRVIQLFTPHPGCNTVYQRLENLLPTVMAELHAAALDGLESGEGLLEWLGDHDNSLDELQSHVYGFFVKRDEPSPDSDPGHVPDLPAEPAPVPELPEDDDEICNTKWQPFPLETLPEAMAAYVQAGSEAIPCDPAYLALPALVAAGGAVGNTRVLRLKDTWREPSIFWGMIIADSSTTKSPAANLATAPLTTLQRDLFQEFERELTNYRRKLRSWEDTPREQRSSMPDDNDGDGPRKPTPRRITVDDITVEKLAMILYDNPRGITLIMDELAGWLGSFTRYQSSKGGGSTLPFWLEAHRGGGKMIDRKGGDMPSIYINRLAASVFGTIQPRTVVGHLNDATVETGFASRLLYAMPPKIPKVWTETIIPAEVKTAYHSMLVNLYAIDAPESHQRGYNPRELEFTPGARFAWKEWYDYWGDRQANSLGETAYALAKLEGYCCRFALLFATIDGLHNDKFSGHVENIHVERACKLVEWFSQEAERVYAMLRTPSQILESNRVLEYIAHRGGSITPRRLFLANRSRYGSVAAVKTMLEGYVISGKGRWETREPGGDGGRPSLVFMLQEQQN